MQKLALEKYEQFDTRRKAYDAKQADRQDEMESRELESKIKRR